MCEALLGLRVKVLFGFLVFGWTLSLSGCSFFGHRVQQQRLHLRRRCVLYVRENVKT